MKSETEQVTGQSIDVLAESFIHLVCKQIAEKSNYWEERERPRYKNGKRKS